MLRIGVTQRVDVVAAYGERRDCLDQRWAQLLHEVGCLCIPLPNCAPRAGEFLDALALDGAVLSGGNNLALSPDTQGAAPERDAFERALLQWAEARELPILAVCRGMQMLNHYGGGSLVPVTGHVACRHKLTQFAPALQSIDEVNSFHDYGIASAGLADSLESWARAEDGTVEAAHHKHLPWLALMWHPEREQPFRQSELDLIRGVFQQSL